MRGGRIRPSRWVLMWDKGVYPAVEGPWGSIGEGLGLGVLHADGDPGSDPR